MNYSTTFHPYKNFYEQAGEPNLLLVGMQVRVQGNNTEVDGVIAEIYEDRFFLFKSVDYKPIKLQANRIVAWNSRKL